MTQRRMPSGQGPSRRSGGASGRPGASRTRGAGPVRVEARPTVRVPTSRSARPAGARRTSQSGGPAATRTAAPRPRALTSRATVLLAVLVVLALAYTYPIRVYLQQEAQIAQMERAQAEQRDQIAATATELAKWNDNEYIRIQARKQLYYVRPGEAPLLVIEDRAGAAHDAGQKAPAAAPDRWYDTLWNSVRAADAEPAN
ncbi:septum formation inhibitor MinC [Actinoplanes sp. SE50]|uniref:septum formation initiator family protein n=1 Tax=unclassified Actinoplanes TaxID=2626549 RepID=UPI00023EC031|nr:MULTISPECIES: septum formation initiator family protein [unclassified Actinoplanes]AEV81831.1 Septum formation initiator protein [Actinoplanes sp. SE50/110]ATO80232.1 septum formation inhibitor MinC [Actinoplanes sp. SE50]SLL97637.1 septum site-determining protein MinC [Actinoplanes sp. SE50/110]